MLWQASLPLWSITNFSMNMRLLFALTLPYFVLGGVTLENMNQNLRNMEYVSTTVRVKYNYHFTHPTKAVSEMRINLYTCVVPVAVKCMWLCCGCVVAVAVLWLWLCCGSSCG